MIEEKSFQRATVIPTGLTRRAKTKIRKLALLESFSTIKT
jgi:hypothetical protein